MKIGIDARLWNETGVGRYIRNLVYNLADIDKHNEYVVFLRTADVSKFKVQNSKFKVVVADIRWHTIEEQLKLPYILEKENLDLVHFPYFSVPLWYKKPFVMTIHDLIINHFPTGKASTLPLYLYQVKRLGYNFIVKSAVDRAQKIIVPLDSVKNDLIQTLGVDEEKITVTYEGVDESVKGKASRGKGKTNESSPFTLHPSPYFLYVGNAYPHKNLERLIKAFSLFRKEQSEEVSLLLVGKDDYFYKKLSEKIKKENYSNVIIRNNVTDKELAGLYRNSLGLVAPSLMEGFGLPVLEAMASNCLVLASDIPSFREVAKDAAIYFDPYSISDMSEKMQAIYDLKQKTKGELIEKGLDRVKNFSWRKMATQTQQVYNSLNTT
jgi:glycosyltransferase involved in cell wall biosynthesis